MGNSQIYVNLMMLFRIQKSEIQDLWVIHDHDYILSLSPELSKIPEKGDYTPMPQVRHPLVRIHPVTQRKSSSFHRIRWLESKACLKKTGGGCWMN